jgi:4-hydroxythreonine-4-phosphate dehydrogenase
MPPSPTLRPLALTIGEPAGIGPDITLAAWLGRNERALPPFFVLGDPDFLRRRAQALRLDIPVVAISPGDTHAAFAKALPVVPLPQVISAEPARPDASSAPAAIGAIREGVAAVARGDASAIVTNPIAKSVLHQAGFSHPGHTEFLAELAREQTGRRVLPVMMLWSPALAVVPVTIHIALKDVPRQLTSDLIVETGRIVARDLQRRFGTARPRLAIAGLNPHAGENGAFGTEERDIIRPAIDVLKAEGIDARGPLPADTLFHAAARATYDAALCMYHDQALIPIKTVAFDDAVNVTLGLPFVRTSPDHGTAFDIAGTGRANPASLIAALTLAARMAQAERVTQPA